MIFSYKESFEGILLAAGSSKRFGLEIPKQFCEIQKNYTVLEKSLEAIAPFCYKVLLILPLDFEPSASILNRLKQRAQILNTELIYLQGGSTRQKSVKNGFEKTTSEYIFIHDGARPLVNAQDLEELLINTIKFKACLLAVPASDTIKQEKERFIQKTIPREHLWLAQTPQAFDRLIFKRALEIAESDNFEGTDDASLVENSGFPVKIIEAHHLNLKITYQRDLDLLIKLISY